MKNLTTFRPEDVITDVFNSVSFKSVLFCRSELRAPWAFSVAAHGMAGFHIVTRGTCWLRVGRDKEVTKLAEGDVVILTRGDVHSVSDHPKTAPTRLDILLAEQPVDETHTFRCGGSGAVTELVCGGFLINDGKLNPLLAMLPRVIHTRGSNGDAAPYLQLTLKYIAEELKANRPGVESVVTRLSDILFIQAVRTFFGTVEGQQVGWLRGLKDPQIGLAIHMIHSKPESSWTVQSLGARVGMSRSSFAERFQTLVGESPLRYLTRWRLNQAAVELRATTAKLPEIAKRAGYESEFAFSRAFKRAAGVSPGAYRKAA
jgi:AraC-like DNA-binding protein